MKSYDPINDRFNVVEFKAKRITTSDLWWHYLYSFIIKTRLNAVLGQYELYKGPINMDHGERKTHARGVYLTQDTSLTRTARVKKDEDADKIIIPRKECGT